MIEIFLKIFTIFGIVGVGYVSEKVGMLPYESNKYLVNLLLGITTPCLLISSMSSRTLDDNLMQLTKEIIIGSFIFFIVGMGISYIIVKIIRYPVKEDEGVLMCIVESVNTGFMGLPVTKAVFGNNYFFLMILENVVLNVYMYILSLFQINYGQQGKNAIRSNFKSMLNNCNYAIIIGSVILFARIDIPELLSEFITTIGDATIPLSMIVVGIQLAGNDFRTIIKNKKLLIACVINVIGVPILTFLVVNWLPVMTETKLIMVFSAAFPCAVAPVAIAAKEGRNSDLMAQGVAITTILSLFTLPCFSVLLMELYGA